jgi:cytochrome P450
MKHDFSLLTCLTQTAVIKESSRVTPLVVSRLPLVAPRDALSYGKWTIPPGTPVSMSLGDILLDGSIFELPLEFRPERWLVNDLNRITMNRFHVPFGRGSRMCIGLNLAMAEQYLVLGNIFRRFDVELYKTTRERDINTARDCFFGEPSQSSPGVMVKIRPVPGFTGIQALPTNI